MKIIRIGDSEDAGEPCRRIIVDATDEEMRMLSAFLYCDMSMSRTNGMVSLYDKAYREQTKEGGK